MFYDEELDDLERDKAFEYEEESHTLNEAQQEAARYESALASYLEAAGYYKEQEQELCDIRKKKQTSKQKIENY